MTPCLLVIFLHSKAVLNMISTFEVLFENFILHAAAITLHAKTLFVKSFGLI
jgi:hypothetical protein